MEINTKTGGVIISDNEKKAHIVRQGHSREVVYKKEIKHIHSSLNYAITAGICLTAAFTIYATDQTPDLSSDFKVAELRRDLAALGAILAGGATLAAYTIKKKIKNTIG